MSNETITVDVQGMHCGSCSGLIDDELADTPGVKSSTTSAESGTSVVVIDPDVVDVSGIVAAITRAGDFTATPHLT